MKEVKAMSKIRTRMGDGTVVQMDSEEIKRDIENGIADAAKKAKVSPLTDDEAKRIYEVIADPRKFVSVEPGNELVLSYDSMPMKLNRVGVPVDRPI